MLVLSFISKIDYDHFYQAPHSSSRLPKFASRPTCVPIHESPENSTENEISTTHVMRREFLQLSTSRDATRAYFAPLYAQAAAVLRPLRSCCFLPCFRPPVPTIGRGFVDPIAVASRPRRSPSREVRPRRKTSAGRRTSATAWLSGLPRHAVLGSGMKISVFSILKTDSGLTPPPAFAILAVVTSCIPSG